MNVGARVGIAVGAGALGAAGAGLAIKAMHGGFEDAAADVREQTAQARTEFDAWNGKLQERFPGGRLDTPQDHREFETFLRDTPAPEWLRTEHEGFTNVHTRPDEFIDWPRRLSSDTPGAGIGFALVGAAAGAIGIGHGIMHGGSNLSTILKIGGGAAALSIGAIAGYMDLGAFQADTGEAARADLVADATMPARAPSIDPN